MVKVNMMCGKRNFGNDWYNVDKHYLNHVHSNDIYLKGQIRESIELIYCSHGIAYFDSFELNKLLSSWLNMLKQGGILRLATPDWDVIKTFDKPMTGPLLGKMVINSNEFIFHSSIFTFDLLKELLVSIGFVNIHRYDHTKTEHPNTGNREDKYDDCSAAYYEGKLISLNVQCYKP